MHKFSGAFFGENGETGNFPTLFCEKFPWKNPCRDSRPARQPPAGTTGKTSRKSPAKTPAGAGEIAGRICQKQDRHQWPELCRAAATACRMAAPRGFMRAVSGLHQVYLRPPYSPPKPHARAERHPCKIHSQHHQHQQTAHTTPPHQPHRHRQHRGQSPQHSTTSTSRQPSPHHTATASASTHNSQPALHQAGQIGTTTAATGAATTTGPARRA